MNASPSRIFNYPRSGNYTASGASSVVANSSLLSPGAGGAASTSCFSESGILSPTGQAATLTASGNHTQQQSSHPMSPTKSQHAQPFHYHKPQFGASASSISSTSYLLKSNYLNSSNRVIATPSAHKAGE